ncbi:GNAT family N-acetyltransferase [Reyranella sp. MMS21-HV4-11]|uniref:GNAT family N-acetyltransferase n=1 Tax=Reyranella humidisoli TaxID=2849149 RepID=A0ABS6IIG8_9HYPH|nr:GNAT family N-acetyltransferase [Reyranella sp. MMS21-HV4-11]MBU8874225.1 GNAT family N-acetyltransferase [Reyranella sp. MMS21-HV4-11]
MAAASESVLEKPQGGLVVRPSTENDVAAMIAIYTHHITRGLGDVDIEPTQADDIKRRRKNMLRRRLPHLAAERDGIIVGYAYAVPFRKRPAYRYAVKHSIYVHPGHVGTGIGRRLLPALIEACASAGYRQMFAYIDADNVASLSLHEAHGFRRAGLLEGVGFKYGKWSDSVLMQRAIGAGTTTPPVEIAYSRTT